MHFNRDKMRLLRLHSVGIDDPYDRPSHYDADEIDLRLTASEILELGQLNDGGPPEKRRGIHLSGIGVWT